MRHICCVSGGKDSAALALHLQDKYPALPMEYVFTDTGHELPEVQDYLAVLTTKLGKTIVQLTDGFCGECLERGLQSVAGGQYACLACGTIGPRGAMMVTDFDYWLGTWDFGPSPASRWCTKTLKIRPLERFLKGRDATVYLAIRADEQRTGNYGLAANVEYRYPLHDDGIDLKGVFKILKDHGLSLPEFYRWRTVGGCYDCFFQNKRDWFGLKRTHPALFQEALETEQRKGFTYGAIPLHVIQAQQELPMEIEEGDLDDYEGSMPCLICAK